MFRSSIHCQVTDGKRILYDPKAERAYGTLLSYLACTTLNKTKDEPGVILKTEYLAHQAREAAKVYDKPVG